MFEKVNPCHPDKVADRIAGALVDTAYRKEKNPRIAVEVLIGHGVCHIIAESSVHIPLDEVDAIVKRIGGNLHLDYVEVPQDGRLANNQAEGIRCGDNGIFKGVPVTEEQKALDLGRLRDLRQLVRGWMYHIYPASLREFVYLRDPAVDRLEKFNHIIKPPFFGGLIGKRRRELDCSPYFQGPYSQRSLSFLSQVYRNSAISHFTEI